MTNLKWILLSLFLPLFLFGSEKTVLLAILARNKEHTLPTYLRCIENQDYDKKLITVYIHTNDNDDHTASLLHDWAGKWKGDYREIVFIDDDYGLPQQNPHDWDAARFHVLASIRNNSLYLTLEKQCDYYFVVDCDNFIIPETLKTLVEKDLPIVAPMLRAIPEKSDYYSNFFCAVDANGYYQNHPDYYPILSRLHRGTFRVPVVHCTYLVRSDVIPELSYLDGTADYEFVIFSRIARQNGVSQYLCNELDFGTLVHFYSNLTLEQEADAIRPFLESFPY